MRRWALRIAIGGLGTLVLLVLGLVGYVEATAASRLRFPDFPAPEIHASTDPAVIEHGRQLAQGVSHCAACHGAYDPAHPEALREDVALSGGADIRPPFGVFYAANITSDRETGIGAWSDAEIARVIRSGVRRNGELSIFMQAAVGDLSDSDLTAIVSYLRALPAVSHVVPPSAPNFMGRAFVTFVSLAPDPVAGIAHVPEGAEPSIARGEYLAAGPGLCVGCHSPPDPADMLRPDPARRFAGGEAMEGHDPAHPELEFAPPNLSADPDTGATGRMTEDQFVDRFRTTGRTAAGSPMPWENFGRLSDSDLRSIYRFIRTAPPVRRNTGPGSRVRGSFTPPP